MTRGEMIQKIAEAIAAAQQKRHPDSVIGWHIEVNEWAEAALACVEANGMKPPFAKMVEGTGNVVIEHYWEPDTPQKIEDQWALTKGGDRYPANEASAFVVGTREDEKP